MSGFEISIEVPGGDAVQLEVQPSYTVQMVKHKLQNHVTSSVEAAKSIRILIHSQNVIREVVSFNRVAEVRQAVSDMLGCQPAFVALTALNYDSDDPSSATWAAARLQDDQACVGPGSLGEDCETFARNHDLTERAVELLKRLPPDVQHTTISCTDWDCEASEFIDQLAATKEITLESPISGADVVVEMDRTLGKPAGPKICSCPGCEQLNLKLLSRMVRGSNRRRVDFDSDTEEEHDQDTVPHVLTPLPQSHLEVRFWRDKLPDGYVDKGTDMVYDWADYGQTWRFVRRNVAVPAHGQLFGPAGKELNDFSTLRACGVGANSALAMTAHPRLFDPKKKKSVVGSAMLAWLAGC